MIGSRDDCRAPAFQAFHSATPSRMLRTLQSRTLLHLAVRDVVLSDRPGAVRSYYLVDLTFHGKSRNCARGCEKKSKRLDATHVILRGPLLVPCARTINT